MNTNLLLQQIIDRPALYFGNRDGYLRDIEALDTGYAIGVRHCTEGRELLPFVPVGFKQHIIDTLAPDNPSSTWNGAIREHSTGEREEWDLFKRLWVDYATRLPT